MVNKPSKARHILGAFQFSVLVKTAQEMLPRDERNLAALQRAIATVPLENRWYPVLQRYLSQLRARIVGLGGKAGHGPGKGVPGCPYVPPSPVVTPCDHHELIGYEGKICGVRFDRFGDFEGFVLNTEHGTRNFQSREKEMEKLVREAWTNRIAILVFVEKEHREEPKSIVFLRPQLNC